MLTCQPPLSVKSAVITQARWSGPALAPSHQADFDGLQMRVGTGATESGADLLESESGDQLIIDTDEQVAYRDARRLGSAGGLAPAQGPRGYLG